MAPPNPLGGSVTIMGGRVPRVVLFVIVATLVGTIVTVNATTALVLVPASILQGEVWRLFTWTVVQPNALGLIFACLLFWFMGPDLVYAWGPGGYLLRYLAVGGGAAVLTCLVALAFPSLRPLQFALGAWSVVDAFIIAWALMFPHRQVYQFFVLPTSGKNLVYFTVGANVLFALLSGPAWVMFLPCFFAMGLMYVALYAPAWRHVMARLRRAGPESKRPRHLRVVDPSSEDKPRWLH
jgi:membrane associated rhomboid family serine protease